jgi:hypothetical protein
MARAKKRTGQSSRKKVGTQKKAKAAKSKAPKSFGTFWTEVGKRLAKEIQTQEGWSQKTFLEKIQGGSQIQLKINDSTKPYFMVDTGAAGCGSTPSAGCASSVAGQPAPVQAMNREFDDLWRPYDAGSGNPGMND